MDRRALGALVLLAALWGGSFICIRIAVPVFGPTALVVGRVLVAALILATYARLRRHPLRLGERWRAYLVLGLINAALPFVLVAIAELSIPASLAAMLNATTPLWGAMAAAWWLGDRLTLRKGLGLSGGVVGVAVVVGWAPLPLTGPALLGVTLMVLATLCYGLGGVYTRKAFAGVAPLELAVGQQFVASILLLPAVFAFPPVALPTLEAIIALLVLAVGGTAIAYLLYFWLIERVGPTATLSVTFLIPVFGIIWSALILGEPLGLGQLVGLGLVLFSLTLAAGTPALLPRQAAARSSAE